MERPEWWEWELVLSLHVELRMDDRGFSEVELREMLERATSLERDHVPGRWVVSTHHRARPWNVLLEPDAHDRTLVVITAFEVEDR